MRNWFFSLQFRLIVSFALVLTLALAGVSAYVGLAADREAERLQTNTDEARARRITHTLERFYSNNGGWRGLQPMLERTGFVAGRDIVVMDADGNLVGNTSGSPAGDLKGLYVGGPAPVVVDKKRVGSVYVEKDIAALKRGMNDKKPPPLWTKFANLTDEQLRQYAGSFEEPAVTHITDATNRSLILAGAGAGLIGLLLVSLISQRMLGSVRSLTAASRKMGAGDLSQRVPEGGRDEVGQLARTFNAMAGKLENAERQRRDMVADVAHELRTPLSNIQGYVEAVRDGVLEPDRATIGTIHQQVLYLADLVEDLRLLTETEADDFRLNREPGSLVETVRESVEGARAKAEASGVVLSVDLPAESPTIVFDRTRISQVVGNLLDNAVRHTPTGGTVTVSAAVGQSSASVTVADTGEGIPDDVLPFVFDRFYRVDPSRSRATGGAGLGLTIARKLVDAHGGSIRVESEAGRGTSFTFDLPLDVGRAEKSET